MPPKAINYIDIWARQLRVAHWWKNLFVFLPLIFSGRIFDPHSLAATVYFFFLFCLLSSGLYLLNDLRDIGEDRQHPLKKFRPIASGDISGRAGIITGLFFSLFSLTAAFMTEKTAFWVLSAYLFNTLAYIFYFKARILTDVLSISIGFMLRCIGGALIIGVPLSRFFLICTFSLFLFLVFAKRRAELEFLSTAGEREPGRIRRTLELYTKEGLDMALSVTAAVCILAYLLFVTDPETSQRHHSGMFIYTVPVVVYCLFKYMFKARTGEVAGPAGVILRDRGFFWAVFIWLLMVIFIIFKGGQ